MNNCSITLPDKVSGNAKPNYDSKRIINNIGGYVMVNFISVYSLLIIKVGFYICFFAAKLLYRFCVFVSLVLNTRNL